MITIVSSGLAQKRSAPVRESIEWLDVWMPNTNDTGLPRVLLIGNSITRGYYPEVQKQLAGKAFVARLATSKSIGDPGLLQEISLAMSYHKFNIIHFNNGLHGWGYSEVEFGKAFPAFIKTIRKKSGGAKLIWATITPVRNKADVNLFSEKTDRIKARNKIALDYLSKQKNIQINDLWELTAKNAAFYTGGDGTHPNPSGYLAIGEKVAAIVSAAIDQRK